MSLNDFNSSLYEAMKSSSSEALIKLLRTIDGPKDLILDDDLISTLDHIASMSELRVSGVEKIFKLGPSQLPLQSPRCVYLVRSLMKSVMLIANHLKADTTHQRQAYIIFVPRKLHVCELILEEEGVYGEVILLEYPLGFIPLDIDVYSLEIPNFFMSYFLEGDQTWLHTAASSLIQLQRFCGSISNIFGVGYCAKMVTEMFRFLNEETRQTASTQSEVDFAIIVDRDIDYPSVLLTQLTYEGLLDETFGIKSARVALGEEVTGKKQVVKIILNSMDEIFKETRDRHFSNVFTFLGNKARHIQAKRDETQKMKVGDMKKFVANELKDLQQQHKYLALHIGACEVIMKQKGKGDFKQHLSTEHNLLDCIELRECMNYIEETINRQLPLFGTLRLLCLLSITQDGLTSRDYKSFVTQFLQSHGHRHLLTIHNLKKLGLFTEQTPIALPMPGPTYAGAAAAKVVAAVTSRGSSFKSVTKKLALIPKVNEDIDLKTPSDMSYVFSGAYIPLICKLAQQLLTREGFQGMDDILKLIGRPTITYSKPRPVRSRGSIASITSPGSENGRSKVILVYFLGGVTYAEISALRLLAKQNNYTLLVATTNLTNGNSLLQQIVS